MNWLYDKIPEKNGISTPLGNSAQYFFLINWIAYKLKFCYFCFILDGRIIWPAVVTNSLSLNFS